MTSCWISLACYQHHPNLNTARDRQQTYSKQQIIHKSNMHTCNHSTVSPDEPKHFKIIILLEKTHIFNLFFLPAEGYQMNRKLPTFYVWDFGNRTARQQTTTRVWFTSYNVNCKWKCTTLKLVEIIGRHEQTPLHDEYKNMTMKYE